MENRPMFTDPNFPPFYVGQRVVGANAPPGSRIINGEEYVINSVQYQPSGNPIANGQKFWYVGVVGSHPWLWPGLFAPIEKAFKQITFEKIIENEPAGAN